MPNVKYVICRLDTAKKLGYPGIAEWYDPDELYYINGVFRFEDGKPVDLVGTDGGEPEDQTLTRDWAWVASTLTKAYALGYQDGSDAISRP
jgi:hypothetical protein